MNRSQVGGCTVEEEFQTSPRIRHSVREWIPKLRKQWCCGAKLFAWEVLLSSGLQYKERRKKPQTSYPCLGNSPVKFNYFRAEEVPEEELLGVHKLIKYPLLDGGRERSLKGGLHLEYKLTREKSKDLSVVTTRIDAAVRKKRFLLVALCVSQPARQIAGWW